MLKARIHICKYTSIHKADAFTWIQSQTQAYTFTQKRTHIPTHDHVYKDVDMHACSHVQIIHDSIQTCAYTCTKVQTCTYTHTNQDRTHSQITTVLVSKSCIHCAHPVYMLLLRKSLYCSPYHSRALSVPAGDF